LASRVRLIMLSILCCSFRAGITIDSFIESAGL
jgi:hypothetical protein